MARERLTDRRVTTLKPPAAGKTEINDIVMPGLQLRVTATGIKAWRALYRFSGEWRGDTLGRYPEIKLSVARKRAGEIKVLADAGTDPRTVKAAAAAADAQRSADTVQAVMERFITLYASQRRWRELWRIPRRDIIPAWRHRPVASITKRDVVDLLDEIALRAPVGANRALTVLKIFFGWCSKRDIIQADPTAHIDKPTVESSRERVLEDDELRAFWRACDRMGWPFGPLFQLLALTAQRKSEIAGLTWDKVDEVNPMIELPASHYKTKRPHFVPLAPAALAIIKDLPRVEGSDWLFSSSGVNPVSGFSTAKEFLDRLMAEELRAADPRRAFVKWRTHDLRRTARTNFSKLGVAADIGEQVLGHVVGGIRGVYDKWQFMPERRAALERWALHLDDIVNPRLDKVVQLRGR